MTVIPHHPESHRRLFEKWRVSDKQRVSVTVAAASFVIKACSEIKPFGCRQALIKRGTISTAA